MRSESLPSHHSMAAAASWRAARQKTAAALLTTAPTERFAAFVTTWAEKVDDAYDARGQTLRARGDYPGLTERPAWPRPAWAGALEAQADVISDEYRKAAGATEHSLYFGGDYGDDYAGLDLAKHGEVAQGARDRFPATLKALEAVADGEPVGATRLAFFARQGPESHVPPHSDMVNFLLTCHLGLIVPRDCRLFFTTKREAPPVAWARGALAPPLQTSFEHAAFNDSDSERVVLFFDVFHPELSREERVALSAFEARRRADEEAFWGDEPDAAPPDFAEALAAVRAAVDDGRARPPGAAPRRRAFSTRGGGAWDETVATAAAAPRRAFRTSAAQAAENAADVRDLLQTRLALTEAELQRVVRHQNLGARATVEPKLDWLARRLDLDAVSLKRFVLLDPSALTKSVERNLEPKLAWLAERLALDRAELVALVTAHPQLLTLSLDENLAPTLKWLQKRLQLDDAELRKVVRRVPTMLWKSVGKNLAPTLDWLQKRLELDAAQLKSVVRGLPTLLNYSVTKNMEPKLAWLKTFLRLDEAQLRQVVLGRPTLLSYSIADNMLPKLMFLEAELELSRAELRAWVVKNPAILGRSLADCYRPRFQASRAAGVDAVYVLASIPYTDAKFYESLAKKAK